MTRLNFKPIILLWWPVGIVAAEAVHYILFGSNIIEWDASKVIIVMYWLLLAILPTPLVIGWSQE